MGNSPPQTPATIQRGYPLPVGTNYLSDDVARLAAALTAIDLDMAAAGTKLISIRSVSGSYQMVPTDATWLVDYSGSSANDVVTLPALGSVSRGWNAQIRNSTGLQITVGAAGGATINGQSLYALLPSCTIQVICDGTAWKVLSIAQVSAGLLTAAGSLTQPSHSFSTDPSVGMYLSAIGQGALVSSGAPSVFWSSSGVMVGGPAGGFKGAGTVNAVKLFYAGQDMIARADGTAAIPTYSFGSEASLGAYRAGAGLYGIAAGGALQFLFSTKGLTAAAATAVPGGQAAGSANLTDLYVQGVSLKSSLVFGPSGVAVAGSAGGAQGAGTLNAQDLFIRGGSLSALLGLSGPVGATLNLSDLQISGNSLANALAFSGNGVAVVGAVGGQKGPGTLNVGALYINGTVLNPGLVLPSPSNALSYLRVNAGGNGIDYRTAAQLLNDLGVQTSLGYVPVNRNGDTMVTLTIQGTLAVGASVAFASSLNVGGVASFGSAAVVGAASVGGSLGVSGVTTLAAASATSLTVNGSLGVSGASSLAALSATTGRFTGGITVLGGSVLAALSATTATFSGAVGLNSSLSVSGVASVAKLVNTGTSAFAGMASFTGGLGVASGNITLGFGQQIATSDSTNGIQFQSGTLAAAAGSTQMLAQFRSAVGTNLQAVLLSQRRLRAGSDWTSSATRLQVQTDAASQGWIEWSSAPSGLGGLRLGAVNASGADVPMMLLDPQQGVTFGSNISVNDFLGVAGGAQLNGGVSMTGGITVDTLTGTASWTTTGDVTCRYVKQTSDERLKKDFAAVSADEALRFVEGVDPVSYAMGDAVSGPAPGPGRHFGYSAQQVRSFGFGDLVHEAPAHGLPDALSLDYSGVTPLLHAALRRAVRQIAALQLRLNDLESRAAL